MEELGLCAGLGTDWNGPLLWLVVDGNAKLMLDMMLMLFVYVNSLFLIVTS